MTQLTLGEIAEKYQSFGIKKGGEFLLPVDKMISMIDDLADQGVLMLGCDLWRYVDRDKNWIVQLVGAGIGIGDIHLPAPVAADMVKQFLVTKLPEDAELVSLLFAEESVYDAFS